MLVRRASCLLPLVVACAAAQPPEGIETQRAALSTYTDVRAWSQQPPGLSPVDVPQFVAVTFDDNYVPGQADPPSGMTWATSFFRPLVNPAGSAHAPTFDGAPVRTSFYNNSLYLSFSGVRPTWIKAFQDGHEIANHTVNHSHGGMWGEMEWTNEIAPCTADLSKSELDGGIGVPVDQIQGFRSPFLEYSSALFPVLKQQGLWYDSSIQSCWGDGQDGSNCGWPHTLDQGSPDGADLTAKFMTAEVPATTGLWEMSASALFVPPDELATTYDFEPGLRSRLKPDLDPPNFYEASTGRLVPLDVTLFADMALTPKDVLAILKYTLDLRLDGNRAPFVFIAHTHVYDASWDVQAPNASVTRDRQEAIEKFVQYALSKPEVRMRPVADIMSWMRDPKPLNGMITMPVTAGSSSGGAAGSSGGPSIAGAAGSGGTGGASAGAGSSAGSSAGGPGGGSSDGCGCRTVAGGGAGAGWLALAALLSVLARRRWLH